MRDEEGKDVDSTLRTHVLETLLKRYPTLPAYLFMRLADTVVARRKCFMWRLSSHGINPDAVTTVSTSGYAGDDSPVNVPLPPKLLPGSKELLC